MTLLAGRREAVTGSDRYLPWISHRASARSDLDVFARSMVILAGLIEGFVAHREAFLVGSCR